MGNDFYNNAITHLAKKIGNTNSLKIALVSDTHLDDNVTQTASNISKLNSLVPLDGLLHLGDFLNGSLPRSVSQKVLCEQMNIFRNCGTEFYPVQGNHDGFLDPIATDGLNTSLDEDWYLATNFTAQDSRVVRHSNNPYYYVDFAENNLRLIVLCTFYNTVENGVLKKVYGTDNAQLHWFTNTALSVTPDTKVIVASHDTPFEDFVNPLINNPRPNGTQLMNAIKNKQQQIGFDFIAWLCGHYHGDYSGIVNGLRFIIIGSQTAYIPQLWSMPKGGHYAPRELGTLSEDLWDVMCFDFDHKKLNLYRFGAGDDREISWDAK